MRINTTNNNNPYGRALYLAEHRSSAHKRFGTGAVIVYGNEIVAEGWSHISHIRHKSAHSLHAEIHALARANHLSREIQANGASIYVATVRKHNNTIALAKPCITCAVALGAAGVKYAIYSINQSEKTCLMLDEDLSKLKRYDNRW